MGWYLSQKNSLSKTEKSRKVMLYRGNRSWEQEGAYSEQSVGDKLKCLQDWGKWPGNETARDTWWHGVACGKLQSCALATGGASYWAPANCYAKLWSHFCQHSKKTKKIHIYIYWFSCCLMKSNGQLCEPNLGLGAASWPSCAVNTKKKSVSTANQNKLKPGKIMSL